VSGAGGRLSMPLCCTIRAMNIPKLGFLLCVTILTATAVRPGAAAEGRQAQQPTPVFRTR